MEPHRLRKGEGSMRRHKLVLMVALFSLAAPATALADDDTRVKRFHGTDSGTFSVRPDPNVPPDPNVVLTEETTTGEASGGIGRYTLVASERVNTATLEVTDGRWTLTAGKGTLSGTYAGSVSFPSQDVIAYHVEGFITGGTGRFAGAGGTVQFDGVASLETFTLSEKMTGELVLPDDEDEDEDDDDEEDDAS
jgi:hypothetical protein